MRHALAHSLGKVQQCQRTLVQLLQFLPCIVDRFRDSTWRGGTNTVLGHENHVNLLHVDSGFVLLWFIYFVNHLVKQTNLLYQIIVTALFCNTSCIKYHILVCI